jgi:cobalamin biosynthesis protein CobW
MGDVRIPVVIISGFLGSGKTTLVRHLLEDAQRSGTRVAVVSNEFGELGIDRALLGEGGQAFVELDGGCVCCQLSDELVETLEQLRRDYAPDRIVIETSGVALPYDTQLNLYREPVASWVGDDVALVVVNAEQLASGRDLEGTFEDQVTSADLIVLNQLDRVEEFLHDELEERLHVLEPEAPVLRCVRGRVDPRVLFAPDPVRVRAQSPQPHSHERFESCELELDGVLEPSDVLERLRGPDVLRVKGFVRTPEGVRAVQGVGARIELEAAPDALDPALVDRVVVIRRAGARDV